MSTSKLAPNTSEVVVRICRQPAAKLKAFLCAGFFTGPVHHTAEWLAGYEEGWADGYELGRAPDVEDPNMFRGPMAFRTAARSYGLPTTMYDEGEDEG
jgi:hypothetical protein